MYKHKCPTVDVLSDYVNGKLKNHKDESSAIEDHVYGEGKSKGCRACLKHIASFNGASETLVNIIN